MVQDLRISIEDIRQTFLFSAQVWVPLKKEYTKWMTRSTRKILCHTHALLWSTGQLSSKKRINIQHWLPVVSFQFKCCSSIVLLPALRSLSRWYTAVWLMCDRLKDTGQRCRTPPSGLQIQTPAFHICVAVSACVCVLSFLNASVRRMLTMRELVNNTGTLVPNC